MAEVSDFVNALIISLSKRALFRGDLDYRLICAAMIFTFFIFGYQKWFSFEAHQIGPFISHSPLVLWLVPAFGIRGASFFLGTTEWFFGALIFLDFWYRRLDVVGTLGFIVTLLGAVTIIPFFPNAWATEAGEFPAMYMFRDLIPLLADRLHMVAPDLPGFGNSDMPDKGNTFDRIAETIDRFTEAIGFDRYAIYVFDYGAPTGFRLICRSHSS
jgi:uncharacterized membrane protein YkgB